MADQIKVLVHGEDGVVSEVLLVEGATTALQAQENVSYEFQNTADNVAPDELLVKRNGDDLEVFSEGSAAPLATIEGYFLLAAPVPLVGAAENGDFYPFVPQTGAAAELPWNLADGASSYQGLGYDTTSSPVPWWPILLAGLLLLGGGAAIAANSSSSKGGKKDFSKEIADAEKALEDAKGAVADAEKKFEDALEDGKVTEDEIAELEEAIKEAEEKLGGSPRQGRCTA